MWEAQEEPTYRSLSPPDATLPTPPEGSLYSATAADFQASDAVVYRSLGPQPPLRSAKYDSKWLRGQGGPRGGRLLLGRRCRGRAVAGRWWELCAGVLGGKAAWDQEILDRYRYSSIPFLPLPTQSHTLSTLWSMETMSTSSSEKSLWRMPGWGG